ncbi:hypothetical protein [Helicobacter mehlei]|uniref:hypothetical protein n=1 Tax=Helicobacter mehlei TaxID=2316080 RepID=UPI000EB04257|nr:hypothetical protein [Helicobacter mehlei]
MGYWKHSYYRGIKLSRSEARIGVKLFEHGLNYLSAKQEEEQRRVQLEREYEHEVNLQHHYDELGTMIKDIKNTLVSQNTKNSQVVQPTEVVTFDTIIENIMSNPTVISLANEFLFSLQSLTTSINNSIEQSRQETSEGVKALSNVLDKMQENQAKSDEKFNQLLNEMREDRKQFQQTLVANANPNAVSGDDLYEVKEIQKVIITTCRI